MSTTATKKQNKTKPMVCEDRKKKVESSMNYAPFLTSIRK